MHLVLRNNRATEARPWGLFHPGEELHHIKKENIGLIEIMGLAILPPRLARELPAVDAALADAAARGVAPDDLRAHLADDPLTAPHAPWAAGILERRSRELAQATAGRAGSRRKEPARLSPVVQAETAAAFAQVLEATGVFKQTEAGQLGWTRFLEKLVRGGV